MLPLLTILKLERVLRIGSLYTKEAGYGVVRRGVEDVGRWEA